MDKDYNKLVETAYNLHVSGKLDEAKAAYDILIQQNPEDLDVLNLYAQLNFSLGNYDVALKIFKEVFEKTGLEDIKLNIFHVYLKLNDYPNALKYALEIFEKNPKDRSICIQISSIYENLGDKENQLNYLLKAVQIKPEVNILYIIGVLYRQLGDDENAVNYFNSVLEIQSNHKFALLNIADIYKNYDKNVSVEIYNRLIDYYPDDTMILGKLYIIYNEMMNYKDSYKIAEKLINIEPDKSYAYSFAGDALYKLGEYQKAVYMFEKAMQLSDNQDYCITMIADCYSIMNMGERAIQIFKAHFKENLETNHAYAFLQLRERNLEEGRAPMYSHLTSLYTEEEIEKRAISFFYKLNIDKQYGVNEATFKQCKKYKKNYLDTIKNYLKKDLYGNNPDNKRILLYSANGIGDMIMFSRYIHILEQHTKDIIIQSPKSMIRLMKYNFPGYEIIEQNEIIDENKYDYSSSFFCLLCSLKGLSLKDIPFAKPYFDVDKSLIQEKSQLDIMKTDKKKIGIFWMGNPVIMPQRSIKLEQLKLLFSIENSQIYSFQIDKLDFESENLKKEFPLIELAEYIKDYADTAAFLKNIDVLVTIDTSIANLAGAMGIKTYLLLPYESEWRWFHDENTTPWYSSIKIFKQKTSYEWQEVIERVKNELTI